jgi:hypothetical protein
MRLARQGTARRGAALLAAGGFVLLGLSMASVTVSDAAGVPASGANFVATGHDMDFHCSNGSSDECNYLKIVTDKVRNGSALPILALDHGTQVTVSMGNIGESPVTTVDPDNAAALNAIKFTSPTGKPLFSAIIVASDASCGGCDNDATGETNINARAADFKTFFNHGGGILALAGADNRATYYNFVPLGLTGAAVSQPFTLTAEGTALGITTTMANCCPTHNSFKLPTSPLVTLETDTAGLAETIAAFNVSIGGGGFSSPPPSKSPTPTPTKTTPTKTTTPKTTTPKSTAPTTPPIPSGAPNTGGGSTAGLQHAALIGLGIGLLVAGAGLGSVAHRRQH